MVPMRIIVQIEQDGRLASVISNQFCPSILEAYQQQNIKVLAVNVFLHRDCNSSKMA